LRYSLVQYLKTKKEFFLVALSQVIGLLSSLIFMKIVSYYALVSEYGLYSLALSIAAFVALFPFTSFDQAIARYLHSYHEENSYAKNYTNILFLYTLMIGIVLLLAFISYPLYESYMSKEVFLVLSLFTILNIYRNMLLQIENFNRKRISILYSKIFEGLGRIGLLLLIMYFFNITALNILLISSLVFFVNIIYVLYVRKDALVIEGFNFSLLKENFKHYYKFSSPLLIWALFSWLQLYATAWFLQYYRSAEEVGYFTLLNTIALIIPTQLVGIIGTFIMPIMYQNECKQKGYTKMKVKQITRYLTLLFIGLGTFFFFFHDFVIELLSSEKYTLYGWLLPYLFFASALSSIAAIWTYEFFVYDKAKKLLVAQTIPSIVSIISCFVLIPSYGIVGVSYVLLLSSGVYLLLILLTYYKFFIYGEIT